MYNGNLTQPLSLQYNHLKYFGGCKYVQKGIGKTELEFIHPVGDKVLARVAELIRSTIRHGDIPFRYGGEEFAVILPSTDGGGAVRVAREILEAIKGEELAHSSSPVRPFVTLSLGVATMIPNPQIPPGNLVEAADQALYEAKEQGRDRVVQKVMTRHIL